VTKVVSFFIFWLSALPTPATAEDISQFVRRADAIGVVNINYGSTSLKSEIANGCGVAYTAYVSENVAGMDEGAFVSFRSYASLTLSGSYLIFFVDGIDQSADAFSPTTGIRAERCAESDIELTAMVIGTGDRDDLGPSAILERRKQPGVAFDKYHLGADYYFGPREMQILIDALPGDHASRLEPTYVDVELANFVARGVLYPAKSFLSFLRDVAKE
jgi:hypothetical protein